MSSTKYILMAASICIVSFTAALSCTLAGTGAKAVPAANAPTAFYARDIACQSPLPAACTPISDASESEAGASELLFTVRDVDGTVCVFHRGSPDIPAFVTEISTLSLPQADRDALALGVNVDGREALLTLLEDLGS